METINKSIFMKAHKCSKATYLHVNFPEYADDNPQLQELFRRGNEVDIEARKLFPLGVDVTAGGFKTFEECIKYTDALISDNIRILYQPCFQHENLRCKSDILITGEKVWKLYEVKSGTSLDDHYILDAAYQSKVIKDCYPKIKLETYIVYINKDFVRKKEFNIGEHFIIENVTNRIRHAQPLVKRYIKVANDTLSRKSIPNTGLSPKCTKPECEFRSFCWKENNIP